MNSNLQRLRNNSITCVPTALLTGVAGVDGNQLSTSFFRFVLKQLSEHPQPSVMCASGQVFVTTHERQVQILNCDKSVSINQLTGGLVPVVPSLVGYLFIKSGDLNGCLLASFATFLSSRQTTAGNPKVSKRFLQPSGVVVQPAIAQGQQRVQADIDANLSSSWVNYLHIRQFQHECDLPFAVLLLDYHMLDDRIVWYRPVELDLHLTDTLDV